MSATSPTKATPPFATWLGLFIALFGILIVRWVAFFIYPSQTFIASLCKESLVWLCAVALLIIIRKGERLPLSSVNVGTRSPGSSILWGIILAVLCALVGGAIAAITHFRGGELGRALLRFPLWFVILVVLRAGIVEELFYRGYAIERLRSLGFNRYVAAAIPILIFGFGHAQNGWANVVIALALGAILTIFYLWRRDLVANMIGHFLVDFVSVVLPRLVSHR